MNESMNERTPYVRVFLSRSLLVRHGGQRKGWGGGEGGGKKSYLSHILGNAQDPFADTTPGYHSKTPIFFCKDGLRLYSMNGFIHTCSIFFFGNRPYHKLV